PARRLDPGADQRVAEWLAVRESGAVPPEPVRLFQQSQGPYGTDRADHSASDLVRGRGAAGHPGVRAPVPVADAAAHQRSAFRERRAAPPRPDVSRARTRQTARGTAA